MPDLSGKVALVTGAYRGIGRAVAERLYADGAAVAFAYLREHGDAGEIAHALDPTGRRAIAVEGDVRHSYDVERMFDELEQQLGAPDIVVACAGVNMNKPIADTTEEDFDAIFSVNVRGTFWVFREAARRINDGGRIIGISSNMVKMGRSGIALYAASKAAVEQFVKTLAREVSPRNVTVNAIAPGPTDTTMVSQLSRETAPGMTPLGRLGMPRDIADAVALIVSEEARWINAQVIGVNGGIV